MSPSIDLSGLQCSIESEQAIGLSHENVDFPLYKFIHSFINPADQITLI
jgi:hypothetical protein